MTEDEESIIPIPAALEHLDVSRFALWKVIREIARQTSGIRIVELERALKAFGIESSRQAIESAIATHKKEFRITRQGREKYVALRAERGMDAATTK
jgi:hypothetical protein